MALPESGRLTTAMVATEFKVAAPYKLSDLFTAAKITSDGGVRKMSSFYGLSSVSWSEQVKLQAPTPKKQAFFGSTVAINRDGTVAVVGATQEDSAAGSAYVYALVSGQWTFQTEIKPVGLQSSTYYGVSVAINAEGNKIVVGATGYRKGVDSVGAVFTFVKEGNQWKEKPVRYSDTPERYSYYGVSISLNGTGDKLIVAARREGGNQGRAYVYEWLSDRWSAQQTLVSSDIESYDDFGLSVTLDSIGTTAVIGAMREDTGATDSGASYVFVNEGGAWKQQTKLLPSIKQEKQNFGYKAALSGDGNTYVVGLDSRKDPSGRTGKGVLCVYTRNGSTWSGPVIVEHDNWRRYDSFGTSVSISEDGNTILAGAESRDLNNIRDVGAVYLFSRQGNQWTQVAEMFASIPITYDQLGESVALSGDGKTAVYGTIFDDTGASNAGAVYIARKDE